MTTEQDPQVAQGRTVAIVLSVLLALSSLGNNGVMLLTSKGEGWSLPAFFFAVGLVIAWCVFQGYPWARSYAAFVAALTTYASVVQALSGLGAWLTIWMTLWAVVFGVCAWLIWTSKSLDAYCRYMDQKRNPSVSMSDTDGV